MVEGWATKGITFVAVSPEPADRVRAFLKDVPVKGWVLADPDRRLTGSSDITVYPTTVINRPESSNPLKLPGQLVPEGVLAAFVEGRPVVVPMPLRSKDASGAGSVRLPGLNAGDTDRDVIRARLTAALTASDGHVESMVRAEKSAFQAKSVMLSTLIEYAYDVKPWQVELEVLPPTETFDAYVEVPGDDTARWKNILRGLVTEGLGLSITREARGAISYALAGTVDRLTRSRLTPGEGQIEYTAFSLDATRIDIDGLCMIVGQMLNAPVENTLHSSESFAIHLKWPRGKEGGLLRALEGIGLRLQSKDVAQENAVVRVPKPTSQVVDPGHVTSTH
jgi:uncharacterized protein (TIGR03435 family)